MNVVAGVCQFSRQLSIICFSGLPRKLSRHQYLFSKLDEEEKDDEDKQVDDDADSSDYGIDDLECKDTDAGKVVVRFIIMIIMIVMLRRGRREVVPDITRQRCVRHRYSNLCQSSASAAERLVEHHCQSLKL